MKNKKLEFDQNRNKKDKNDINFMDWRFILVVCVFLGAKQFFDYQHKLDNQKKVNMIQAASTTFSNATDDEKNSFQYVESILLNEMTAEEKERNVQALSKMANNTATKQDLIDKGKMFEAVVSRLPKEKKLIVEKFFDNVRIKHGERLKESVYK